MPVVLINNCDNTVVFNEDREDDFYSINGGLNLNRTENYIRVVDNREPLTPETTKELKVDLFLKNLTTGTSTKLEKRIDRFDEIYTHNYIVDIPLDFNDRFKLTLFDNDGFTDSMFVTMPREPNKRFFYNESRCDFIGFEIKIYPVSVFGNERIDWEIEFEYNDRSFSINQYIGNNRTVDEDTVSYNFHLQTILGLASQNVLDCCYENKINELTFKYRIVKEEEDENNYYGRNPENLGYRRLVSMYNDTMDLVFDDSLFQDNLFPNDYTCPGD